MCNREEYIPKDVKRGTIFFITMATIAQTEIISKQRSVLLALSFMSICVFLLGGLSPYIWAQYMEEEPETFEAEPFIREGSSDGERIIVAAEDIQNAIDSGSDIVVNNAIIEGDLFSDSSVIQGSIEINYSEIRGTVAFGGTVFENMVSFSFVDFTNRVSFDAAMFGEYTKFNSTTFGGDTEFSYSVFGANTEFISAIFKENVSFTYAIFEGYAYFRGAIFSRDVLFQDATFNGALDFADATFTKRVTFLRAAVSQPGSFAGVNYHENTVISGLWNDILGGILRFLPKMTVTDFSQLDTGTVMDGSSNPFLRRYIDDEQWIKSWRESTWWRKPLYVLWEMSSHCGRSIGLWGFWSALIAFGYAVIYSKFLSNSIVFSVDRLKNKKPEFRSYLYYSIVTLTTLGYGDIVPLTGMARLVVGAEVTTGYIMLGGLVSIFATKFATRS